MTKARRSTRSTGRESGVHRREKCLTNSRGRPEGEEPGLEPYREKEAFESERRKRRPSPDQDPERRSFRREKRKADSGKTTVPKKRVLRVGLPQSAAQELGEEAGQEACQGEKRKANPSKTSAPEKRVPRVGKPQSAAQGLREDSAKQLALRVGAPKAAAQRLQTDPSKMTVPRKRVLRVGKPQSAAQRLREDSAKQRELRVGSPKPAAQRLKASSSKTTVPGKRVIRVGKPRSAAQRLREASARLQALRVGSPESAAQRLSEDLPRSAFLHSRMINERRAADVTLNFGPSMRELEIDYAEARPKQGLAESPAEETSKMSLDLGKVGKSDIEAESESEVTDGKERDGLTKIAERRNLKRVSEADACDHRLLSKYLPATIDEFLPPVITGPDDSFVPPAWLMQAIKEVAASKVPTPLAPPIRFDLSDESVRFNSDLLKANDMDLGQFLSKHQDTTLNFGSEFRPISDLEKILGQHPNFRFFSKILADGMDYRFTNELSEEQRKAEVAAMMERGNHQSVQEDSEEVAKLLAKDVLQGFSLPVLPELVPELAHAMVQPAGVVKQFSLREDGSRTLKRRLTQDLSFPLTFPTASVNKRIDMSAYVEMIYGWCLSRVIHFIVALRLAHPLLRIFIMKYDYSDAYRRVAHSPSAAAQSIIIFAGVAYIALRLTFGGSPNPPTWCSFSEMVTDLSNEIPLCKEWDHESLRSPAQPETPSPVLLPDDIPIAKAMPMAVCIPTKVTARSDSFIDDLIRVFLDTPLNREREPHAVPLAIHVTSRPHAGDAEPVKRREIVSDPKLVAEGGPAEDQIVLGWILNTRTLLVILPSDKFEAWPSDLQTIITERKSTFGQLETTVGRLNHAAFIIPLSRHFLNRIRLRIKSRKHKNQALSLTQHELDDFDLWVFFLSQARAGISMNQMTVRQPSKICWSDSCPFGIGGFLLSGRAWRIRITESSPLYGLDIANNVLEFLGMMVTIWLVLVECEDTGSKQDCILALGDNTSAIGWLYKSGQLPLDSPYYKPVQLIARQLARLVTASSHCLASQHIKGDKNTVADLLSYAGDTRGATHPLAPDYPSDRILTERFHSCLPQSIPANFNISPLPREISSFVIQALQTLESSLTQNRNQPMRTRTGSGDDGLRSVPKLASTLTLSSLDYNTRKPSSSCAPFCPCTEWLAGAKQEPFLASVRAPWYHQLCVMPQATWLRRSGVTSNGAPFTSKGAPSSAPPFGPS